ncbi:CoA-acylating methylmalonate-semialdehyde dehydrogenase [Prauserella halophila]|uniref:CoA-acylating methylmalonate-semialdehyde dehydrogenase n=1 Tax=Prauserella halophila TaxID=185641 RepID=UPI0020A5667A|nr:CoA-acylating methylmalonate-semialdehyde dehydrogenase [Prauserella halophila]MCP2234513.1 malonate-semialdehyde dehydrogenase (acetylating) / methylmalonate-semialdehyde dehydrogenase [Prauserella halophila]
MSEHITHRIAGKSWFGTAERTGEVFDPATGTVQAHVDFAGTAEVDEAVRAAAAAFPAWRDTSLAGRTRVLFRFRELLAQRQDDLARLITAEHGKVVSDAAGEVARALENVEYACSAPQLLKGEFSENASTGVDVHSTARPLGVVGVISPFNFPAMVPLWFVPNAIACGNTVVLKPSEKDPSASLLIAELLAEAGLPDGVLNVVHGDKAAVDAMLDHPGVEAVSFVGSTPIARYVYEKATAAGKRCQALGGAKNHMAVLPDADLDGAADAAVSAGFGSAGERCMAVSVVVAVDPIGDELVAKLTERIAGLRVGDGREPDSEMGPLVTAAHRERVASYIDAGLDAGATLAVDGREPGIDGGGFWLGPTLFDRVRPEMPIYTDEIFGPVLSVVRAASLDEAVELINANHYGNGTAVFTGDGGAARRFTGEVEVGMVGVNVPIPVPVGYYSFGGWKDSLFGDSHAYGPEGFHFFTRRKVVTSRWPSTAGAASGGVNLRFPGNT